MTRELVVTMRPEGMPLEMVRTYTEGEVLAVVTEHAMDETEGARTMYQQDNRNRRTQWDAGAAWRDA